MYLNLDADNISFRNITYLWKIWNFITIKSTCSIGQLEQSSWV